MPIRSIREFIKLESSAGIILCITALLGLIVANTPLEPFYHSMLFHPLMKSVNFNAIINDGLMVLFFFLVGLEIKREILFGELNTKRKIMLPAIAALGGMIIPAVIFIAFNYNDRSLIRGWAIPTATDIAFALAVLSLLGRQIPLSIKTFLTAIAIFDDLGAIIIIALFYSHSLAWHYLIYSALVFACLISLKYFRLNHFGFYLFLGVLLWFFILKSGVHPTIAGVLFALGLPVEKQTIEHQLHPWVAYFILPLFAFANTGIPIHDFHWSILLSSLSLGITLGLLIGKQLGVFLSVLLSVKFKIAHLPSDSNLRMIYGVAILCGIGFTMSLFIGGLAFTNEALINTVRIGVLTGSLISGICGYLLLKTKSQKLNLSQREG